MSQKNDSEEVKHDSYMTSIFRPRCDTCERSKEEGETGCLDLGDGRELCSDCSSIAVTDLDECHYIIQSVFEFYKKEKLKVDEKIPIFFIDRIQMSKLSEDGALGLFIRSMWSCFKLHSGSALPVRVLVMFVRFIICRIHTIEKYSRSGGEIKKVLKCPIGHAIAILFGKADVAMGATLAHEMMHAWFCLQGIPWECERSVEEGICVVMAYRWLQWFPTSGFDNPHKTNQQVQYTKELKELLVERIRCQTDQVYGQGFIDAMRAIETVGFKPTLDHVIKTGTLPQPMIMSAAAASTTAVEHTKELKELSMERIWSKGDEVSVQQFVDDTRAIGTVGFKLILDHVVKNGTLPPLMKNSTCSAATVELIRKNINATPQPDQVLCKASSNTTKSFWKTTIATIINFVSKAPTTWETPRIIFGHCHDHYHQGQSHINLHEAMLSAIVSVFIIFEHR